AQHNQINLILLRDGENTRRWCTNRTFGVKRKATQERSARDRGKVRPRTGLILLDPRRAWHCWVERCPEGARDVQDLQHRDPGVRRPRYSRRHLERTLGGPVRMTLGEFGKSIFTSRRHLW